MTGRSDGGRTALAGYLYQMIGVLGLKAHFHSLDDGNDVSELKALIELAGTGSLHHERYGQDADIVSLIPDVAQHYLIQFKFSRKASFSQISVTEFKEILTAFIASEDRLLNLGHSVTYFAIISNRRLSARVSALMKTPAVISNDLGVPEKRISSVLQRFEFKGKKSMSYWETAIRAYAQSLGVTESEITRCTDEMVGHLIRAVSEGVNSEITKEYLTHTLTGHHSTLPLDAVAAMEHCRRRLDHVGQHVGLLGAPIRRSVLDELSRLTREHALVILSGEGGNGKTVALWQWTHEMIGSVDGSPTVLSAFKHSGMVSETWIQEFVADLADLPPTHPRRSEPVEQAISRVEIANPNSRRPIVNLGLDGMDERLGAAERNHQIQRILQPFWGGCFSTVAGEPPVAALVVTCRDDEDLMRRSLYLDLSGFGDLGPQPPVVRIPEFSEDELLQAARPVCPELAARLERRPPTLGLSTVGTMAGASGLGFGNPLDSVSPSLPDGVLDALKHPAMWRSFLELEDRSRLELLNGEESALAKLGGIFVWRFCRKLIDRGALPESSEHEVLVVLRSIAARCRTSTEPSRPVSEWIAPAVDSSLVDRKEARRMYREAISGGLVRPLTSESWWWRHEPVRIHLESPSSPTRA